MVAVVVLVVVAAVMVVVGGMCGERVFVWIDGVVGRSNSALWRVWREAAAVRRARTHAPCSTHPPTPATAETDSVWA